jgi:hypothetical protein
MGLPVLDELEPDEDDELELDEELSEVEVADELVPDDEAALLAVARFSSASTTHAVVNKVVRTKVRICFAIFIVFTSRK